MTVPNQMSLRIERQPAGILRVAAVDTVHQRAHLPLRMRHQRDLTPGFEIDACDLLALAQIGDDLVALRRVARGRQRRGRRRHGRARARGRAVPAYRDARTNRRTAPDAGRSVWPARVRHTQIPAARSASRNRKPRIRRKPFESCTGHCYAVTLSRNRRRRMTQRYDDQMQDHGTEPPARDTAAAPAAMADRLAAHSGAGAGRGLERVLVLCGIAGDLAHRRMAGARGASRTRIHLRQAGRRRLSVPPRSQLRRSDVRAAQPDAGNHAVGKVRHRAGAGLRPDAADRRIHRADHDVGDGCAGERIVAADATSR